VLGHTKCGAVQATYDAYPSAGDVNDGIGSLVASIYPAVNTVLLGTVANRTGNPTQVDACIDENIKLVTEEILLRSPIVEDFVNVKATVKIKKAKYDISTGIVTEQF
jgi:carbonic anhydrase